MNSFFSKFEKYSLPVLENGVRLPDFHIEQKFIDLYNLKDSDDHYSLLKALCEEGLRTKVDQNDPRLVEYKERAEHELSIFNELGFCSYLLITWDIVNHCYEDNIPIGYGRGSAGNSLVLFLIGVTQVDSLKYNLYFERFLNKTRAKFQTIDGVKYYEGSLLMDVDLDIGAADRKKLVAWVNDKYNGKIAKLPTTITLTTKTLIKEVCKLHLEMKEDEAMEISEMIPLLFNIPVKLEEAYEQNSSFKEFADENPEAIKVAKKLYELNKYYGVHASAWIITYDDINDIIPLRKTKEGELCSVYTMNDASDIAIKIDLLGLKCVSLINKVCKMVGVNPYKIDIHDDKVYEWLRNLEHPRGIFQIEGDCNFGVAQKIKPRNLSDLAAIVALARPGVLQFGDVYAKYLKTGEFQSIHPFFDDILKDTAGIPLYQESLLRMANKVGFTLSESEDLRRCIGKKKVEEMPKWEKEVEANVKKHKLDPNIGKILWKIMDDSKNYSFNAGHATGYGLMSYVTAYLKCYYPKEFFLALLELTSEEQNVTQQIQEIEMELPHFGMRLLGPDLMKSELSFSIDGDYIRFGLGYIKGISKKSFEKLLDFKHEYPNKFSIFCSSKESGLNIGVLSALIMSGAMDTYITESRSKAVLEAQLWNLLTDREKIKMIELGEEFRFDLIKIINHLKTVKNENGKPFFKDSRLETIRKKFRRYKEIYNQNYKNEEFACYWYERKLLGYSYSKTLFDIIKKQHLQLVSVREALDDLDGEHVTICGEIKDCHQWKAKRTGNPTFRATITDSTGEIDVMLFGDSIEQEEIFNGSEKFAKEWIVAVEGKKKTKTTIYADKIRRKEQKIYMKLADVK